MANSDDDRPDKANSRRGYSAKKQAKATAKVINRLGKVSHLEVDHGIRDVDQRATTQAQKLKLDGAPKKARSATYGTSKKDKGSTTYVNKAKAK